MRGAPCVKLAPEFFTSLSDAHSKFSLWAEVCFLCRLKCSSPGICKCSQKALVPGTELEDCTSSQVWLRSVQTRPASTPCSRLWRRCVLMAVAVQARST